jgi:hypothetical protein
LFRKTRIGVSNGNDSIKEEGFFQMGTLSELPQEDENVEDDDQEINDRKVL